MSQAHSTTSFASSSSSTSAPFRLPDGGELLVYPINTGETVPFWSSRSRLENIQRRLPKYRQWDITEFSLIEFWRRLAQLEREGIQVGVNWSGTQLTGYNISVRDLRAGLEYWIDRLDKRRLLEEAG